MNSNKNITLFIMIIFFLTTQSNAEHLCWQREELAEEGIEFGLGITNIYQQNTHGGLSTHRKAGRYSGSYDLEMLFDLDKLSGLDNAGIYIHAEGGWTDTEGINGVSVGSAFGINADAKGNRSFDIIECFYEGELFNDSFDIKVGKFDLTCIFDGSEFADCECTQFMNVALVDNPTIPFPEYSLGIILTYEPEDSWYIMAGAADAQADGRETGFRTAFYGEDYFLYMLETGIKSELASARGTLYGTYRIGFWNDPQPKANSDSLKNYRDDIGFYVSCDQMLMKENSQPEDEQGLGAFIRYGYADSKTNDITNFWSAGFQYEGLIEGRDNDVLGAGFAYGVFSNSASSTYTEDYENALELYYNAQIKPWINLSPSVQYITNPGGNSSTSDALVVGLRAQMLF